MKDQLKELTFNLGGKTPLTLKIKLNDITLEQAEVLVNSTKSDLKLGLGISGDFLKTGGPKLQEECDLFVKQKITQPITNASVVKTGTGYFTSPKIKKIFHSVIPNYNERNALYDLQLTFKNCLQLAEQEGLRSIAFPAVGTGSGNFPLKECAVCFFKAVDEFIKNKSRRNLQTVIMCLINEDAFKVFMKEQEVYFQKRGKQTYGHDRVQEVGLVEEKKTIKEEIWQVEKPPEEVKKVSSWRRIGIPALFFSLLGFSLSFFLIKTKDRLKNYY